MLINLTNLIQTTPESCEKIFSSISWIAWIFSLMMHLSACSMAAMAPFYIKMEHISSISKSWPDWDFRSLLMEISVFGQFAPIILIFLFNVQLKMMLWVIEVEKAKMGVSKLIWEKLWIKAHRDTQQNFQERATPYQER